MMRGDFNTRYKSVYLFGKIELLERMKKNESIPDAHRQICRRLRKAIERYFEGHLSRNRRF